MHKFKSLYQIIIKTPRLELRIPNEDEIVKLAELASGGVHKAGKEYYNADWLRVQFPNNKEILSLWIQKDLKNWDIDNWSFLFAAFYQKTPIGMQHIFSKNFVKTRTFGTGVWLGLEYQGQGFATEMGQVVLYLGFEIFGAKEAYAGVWKKNKASLQLLNKLGYIYNGRYIELLNDKPEVNIRMRLTRDVWKKKRLNNIIVEGINKEFLELFGLSFTPDVQTYFTTEVK